MKRIYLVAGKRLVRAHTRAGARNFVAQDTISVELASQESLVTMLSKGAAVEEALPEQADLIEEASAVVAGAVNG